MRAIPRRQGTCRTALLLRRRRPGMLRAAAILTEAGDERRGKPGAHAGRGRGRGVLRQPRHLRDAFRRGARPRPRHALRARPVRGRRHRRRRRLRPHGRQAGRHPAASGAGAGQRHGQSAQRQQGFDADRQHRRRPRHLSPPLRRTADLRHRERGPHRLALGQDRRGGAHARRRRGGRDRRRAHAAGAGRHPDPAGRYGLERGLGSDAGAARASAGIGCARGRARGRAGAARGRGGIAAAGRPRAARRRAGARLLAQTFNARIERGRGRVAIERIPYPVDQALAALAGLKHVILVGAKMPVAFFAYPGKPSLLAPADAAAHVLARPEEDAIGALAALAEEVGAAGLAVPLVDEEPPAPAAGAITPAALAASLGALLPENAIVVDEGVTTGRGFFPSTRAAAPHDWLQNMGGSIGIGLPLATGAAVACPERTVVALEADGSAMYTIQALWTQAREGLAVKTVLFNNKSYAILRHEMANVGAGNPGRKALDMLALDRPALDFVGLARGMGVPGARVATMEEFNRRFAEALATPGPFLVEVLL